MIGVSGRTVANRGDASVHHVARRDDVGSGLDVRDGRAREQLERRVVVDLSVVDHAAVAVRRVFAQADVGDQQQLRKARPQRAERLLDDAVVDPGAGALVVLLLRDPEQDHGADADAHELLDLAHDGLDGVALQRRQPLVRERGGRDEERHHEVVERDRRLADEVAQRAGATQAAQAGGGERAHGRRVRGGSTSTSSTSTGTGVPCHGSRVSRSAKNSQIARPTASSGSAVSAPGKP